MTTDSLKDTVHYASLLDTARLIQSKELSPVDLTHWMLDRIAAVDGRLRSCATVTAERALAAAQDAAQEIVAGAIADLSPGKSAGECCM
jgi:Asp-tRNA(Asn)/Glu-tRNA(Gln) amidotransferase A subunit family amidase